MKRNSFFFIPFLSYSKKMRRPPSPEILHTSPTLPTDIIPSTRTEKSPPTVTENCIVSDHTTAFRPPCVMKAFNDKRNIKFQNLQLLFITVCTTILYIQSVR